MSQNSNNASHIFSKRIEPQIKYLLDGKFFSPFTVYIPNDINLFTSLLQIIYSYIKDINYSKYIKIEYTLKNLVPPGQCMSSDYVVISFSFDLQSFAKEV